MSQAKIFPSGSVCAGLLEGALHTEYRNVSEVSSVVVVFVEFVWCQVLYAFGWLEK